MNLTKTQKIAKTSALAIGVGFLTIAATVAKGEILTGLTFNLGGGSGQLVFFDSATPETWSSAPVAISGAGGEAFVGIDYIGTTLYGVSAAGKIYTINTTTGIATQAGGGSFGTLTGTYFGVDATLVSGNPRVRIIGAGVGGINDLVNGQNGNLVSADPSITGRFISGISTRSDTVLFGVDTLSDQLYVLNATTGGSTLVGSFGNDMSGKNGFDISPNTGIAYLGCGAGSSALAANLWTVDLSTGAVTSQGSGSVGFTSTGENILLYGLTVAAVPEPGTTALFVLGGAGMLALIRRRK